ncbi:MAG: hypothetical protein SGPRY_012808, partial [Prymnesium sp.]
VSLPAPVGFPAVEAGRSARAVHLCGCGGNATLSSPSDTCALRRKKPLRFGGHDAAQAPPRARAQVHTPTPEQPHSALVLWRWAGHTQQPP